ncbi:MAG: digeranylgeranylglyceryl phosphate synthase [Candidatus Neomarinimicrobiota bacterium]|nr:MAG: digeranylgeranylglyceryl phosphate synthase [Candidatus Neomarinimicrobiota bacterium]
MVNTIYYYIKLLRPLNVMTSALAIIIATAILEGLNNHHILLITTTVVMLYTAASNALNDALDYEIDLINKPERPIPLGYVSIKGALFISFLLFAFGVALCLQLPDMAIVIGVFISLPLMVTYSTSLKGKYLIGNLVVSFLLGASFLFVGASHEMTSPMLIPMLLAFGLTFLREIIKDVADIEGDLSLGLKTYPIISGVDSYRRIIISLCLLVGLFSLVPYLIGIYGPGYLLLLMIGVEIPLLIIMFIFFKNPSISSAIFSARLLKFSTLMGLLSIYCGTV